MSALTHRLARVSVPETPAQARRIADVSRLLPWLVLVVTLVVFGETGTFGFVSWDDGLHVSENPWLHPVTLVHVRHFWRTPYQGLYIPLSYTVYALLALLARDPATHGLNPHVFHAANLVLHLTNALLVFALLKKFVPNVWASAAGSLLFAVHPMQVESVAWVSELRGLLSGTFALLALGGYVEFATSRDWRRYAVATVAFGLALLAKPSAVSVPLVALALTVWGLGLPWKRCLPPLAMWAVMAFLCAWVNHTAQSVPQQLSLPAWQRFFVAGDALAFYLGHLAWPAQLGIDYGRSPFAVLAHGWGYVAWLVPVCLGLSLWARRRCQPLLFASGAVFFLALLPTLGLMPFAFQLASTVADRYVYLAMLGPSLATAWLLARVPRRVAPLAVGFGIGTLLLMGLQSSLQASYWQNDFALFSRALAVNPRSWIADNDLGTALLAQGRTEQAITAFQASLRWNPSQENAWNNLGAALYSEGRLAEAVAALRNAQRLAPDNPTITDGLETVSRALHKAR